MYGAKVVYDGVWNTHRRLTQLLKFALPKGIRCAYISSSMIRFCFRLPLIVPGKKLRESMFTQRRYLKGVAEVVCSRRLKK